MPVLSALPSVVTTAIGSGWISIEGPTVLEVAQGEIVVGSGDELVRAGCGDLVCVTPGTQLRLRSGRAAARIDRLDVDPSWVGRALALAGSDRSPGEASFLVDRCATDRARRGARLLREIANAAREPGEGGRLRLAARCVELLAMAFEPRSSALAAGGAVRGSDRRARFLRAVETLGGESFEEVTLPAFARRAGLSERHVSRLFQLELGRTFREHLAELRLERAKSLLRETEMTVIEVAGETGWSSLAHFNSVFRRRVGYTPRQFRMSAAQ
jgi:AraC family transcriptional regulator